MQCFVFLALCCQFMCNMYFTKEMQGPSTKNMSMCFSSVQLFGFHDCHILLGDIYFRRAPLFQLLPPPYPM